MASTHIDASILAQDLARDLIRCPSVTPADAGALDVLGGRLDAAGFTIERVTFGDANSPAIDNLFASIGSGTPHLMLTGHTDVVPPGNTSDWRYDPFSATVADDRIFGRGAVDMKGGLACLAAAAIDFVSSANAAFGRLSFMVTGDEEGPAVNGTRKLIEWAAKRGEAFDAAVLAEPTSREAIGDTIKIGRRGSVSGRILVRGVQGHVAYPHLSDNPVPLMVRILDHLASLDLDEGNEHFEPSSLQMTSVDVGNPADNVTPARIEARFNIRHSTEHSAESLRDLINRTVTSAAGSERDKVSITFAPNPAQAFLTDAGGLVDLMRRAVTEVTGLSPELTTGGGTSDARFIKDYCPIIEIGLIGQTMHQIDENTTISDIETLTAIFRRFLNLYFRDLNARA